MFICTSSVINIASGRTMIICVCKSLNERRLRETIAAGAHSFDELQFETGVSTCCGTCEESVHELLASQVGSEIQSTELHRVTA